MKTAPARPAVSETVAIIEKLDLEPIKLKLMDAEDGPGWSREKTERTAGEYRRYLILLAKYPDETVAPSKDVDKVWHAHILDTQKYADDCAQAFGGFLHHFPYFGLRGAEDRRNLDAASDRMKTLYEAEFGVAAREAGSPAYCIRSPEPGADAAYCIRSPEAARDSAYCIRGPVTSVDAAYCIRGPVSSLDAAYCIRSPASDSSAAYCIRAPEPETSDSAYCIRTPMGAESRRPDVTTRPRLAA